jgi:hypothetical protein
MCKTARRARLRRATRLNFESFDRYVLATTETHSKSRFTQPAQRPLNLSQLHTRAILEKMVTPLILLAGSHVYRIGRQRLVGQVRSPLKRPDQQAAGFEQILPEPFKLALPTGRNVCDR